MTNAPRGTVHEHRTNGRSERIRYRQSLKSVVVDELGRGVSGKVGLWARINDSWSEQGILDIVPAARSRVRMGALLRQRCCLHQSVVDAPINFGVRVNDPLRIIVTNYRHGFLCTLRRSETETAPMLHRLIYGRLAHGAHGFHRKGWPGRRFFGCWRWLLRSYPHRLFSARAHRFRQEFPRFFRDRRRCLRRDHLDYIVRALIASTVAAQAGRRQALGACARAERHRNQCSC